MSHNLHSVETEDGESIRICHLCYEDLGEPQCFSIDVETDEPCENTECKKYGEQA